MKNFNRALNHACAINLIYYAQYQERRNRPPFFSCKNGHTSNIWEIYTVNYIKIGHSSDILYQGFAG